MIGPAEIEEMMAERAEAREASRSEAQAGAAVLALRTDPTPESAPPLQGDLVLAGKVGPERECGVAYPVPSAVPFCSKAEGCNTPPA